MNVSKTPSRLDDRRFCLHNDAIAGADERLGVLRQDYRQYRTTGIGDVGGCRSGAVGLTLGSAAVYGAVLYQLQIQERLARPCTFAGNDGDIYEPGTIDVFNEKFSRSNQELPSDLFRSSHQHPTIGYPQVTLPDFCGRSTGFKGVFSLISVITTRITTHIPDSVACGPVGSFCRGAPTGKPHTERRRFGEVNDGNAIRNQHRALVSHPPR